MKRKLLRKEQWYPQSPYQVWTALTDRQALAEWLMPNDFSPVVGHRFRFQVNANPLSAGTQECQVLEVDPPRRLVYDWVVVPRKKDMPRPKPMILTWTLEPERTGTRLVLEQRGIENIGFWIRFSMNMGWGRMIATLLPKVLINVAPNGAFTPGAIPPHKRDYPSDKIDSTLTR